MPTSRLKHRLAATAVPLLLLVLTLIGAAGTFLWFGHIRTVSQARFPQVAVHLTGNAQQHGVFDGTTLWAAPGHYTVDGISHTDFVPTDPSATAGQQVMYWADRKHQNSLWISNGDANTPIEMSPTGFGSIALELMAGVFFAAIMGGLFVGGILLAGGLRGRDKSTPASLVGV